MADIPVGATHQSDKCWYRIPGKLGDYDWINKGYPLDSWQHGRGQPTTQHGPVRPLAAPTYFIYSSPPLKAFDSLDDAVQAAEKEALDNPGRKFYVAQCAGTVQTETTLKKEGFNG